MECERQSYWYTVMVENSWFKGFKLCKTSKHAQDKQKWSFTYADENGFTTSEVGSYRTYADKNKFIQIIIPH